MIERYNRTLIDTIASMLDPAAHQRDWDKYLAFATAAYRSCPQESTGETSSMMMMGREVVLPPDLAIPPIPGTTEDLDTDYALKLREIMRNVHEKARNSLREAASRQKQHYDKATESVQFHPGEFVWMRKKTREKGLAPKLQPRWLGPYLVVTKLSDVTFRLQLSPRSHPFIVHADRLKPYTGAARDVWQYNSSASNPPTRDDDEDAD
ncbi:uncharacterized protein LOC121419685 [Lytechinus variegatus]|uniref:uncharacterized protein LOC121419685 n=1 Tax=Lytechinus variegatus TaxID=7654 RepID=UPI001BB22B9C|nr:uncharacterized protein LOC121419685 [Lytechinus variegatus]